MTPIRWHYAPTPISVPKALLDAFELLKAEAVLVGGSAVQVWVGRRDGIFATGDLDFISHLAVKDLAKAGLHMEGPSGRHVVVEGVPIEFPSGPLGLGSSHENRMGLSDASGWVDLKRGWQAINPLGPRPASYPPGHPGSDLGGCRWKAGNA